MLMYRLLPVKTQQVSLGETDMLILKFKWKCKGFRKAKIILENKNKIGGIKLFYFRTYYKVGIAKTMWHQQK